MLLVHWMVRQTNVKGGSLPEMMLPILDITIVADSTSFVRNFWEH